MKPSVNVCEIGDTAIQYLLYEGDGPTVMMLHATGFLPWLWHPIARRLSGEYRIIAPYFCDHRHAEPEDGGLSWMILAEDLCRFCEVMRIGHPLPVGHSMGATGMTIANAVHGAPAERMVIIEPIFLPGDFYRMKIAVEQHPLASKSIKRRNRWENRDEAKAYLRSRALFKKWDEEMLDLYLHHGMIDAGGEGLTLACSPRREASLFMGGMQYDPWPLLPELSCPVLVVEGEESENRQFIDLKKAVSLMPLGEYISMPGAGHLIPMEKPVETVEMIRNFFSRAG